MKWSIFLLLMLIFTPASAQDEEYWELYETYAASSAAKYHDILDSIESGDIDSAKEKLLSYQGAEILVLEKMREERQLKDSSQGLVEKVRQYNERYFE